MSLIMSYTGTVRNGVVILPAGAELPDGAQVEVTITDTDGSAAGAAMARKRVAALQKLAASGGISSISDPEDWQRQSRVDRELPGRGT